MSEKTFNYSKEQSEVSIAQLEADLSAAAEKDGIESLVEAALFSVSKVNGTAYWAGGGRHHEAWVAALMKTLVKFGYPVKDFLQRYNAVCGVWPQITTESWFREVNKEPDANRLSVQFGVHLEEVREMFPEISSGNDGIDAKMMLIDTLLKEVAHEFKTGGATLQILNRKNFFDSILDQHVTGVGTAQYAGFNYAEGLARVDLSNFTKFVDGKVIYKEGGKVDKGPCFTKPDLTGLGA